MITPEVNIGTDSRLDSAVQQIVASMTELLARAVISSIEVDLSRWAGSTIRFRQIEVLSKTHRMITPDQPAPTGQKK
ncbi:MAG: hypothetical protein HOB24_05435 [Chloroflexi bacterium]|nr:hypothetical protein [Chloroflexota bacterium]MBT6707329.1 hypothetical protein [Chloroflexota bacterium]